MKRGRSFAPASPDPWDGVLLVDKPSGFTSHDVVAKVRGHFRIKKVGHGGTLDPMATGLLILLLGRGTRLSAQVGVMADGGYQGLITAFTDGGNPIRFWFYHMFRGDWAALAVIVPAAVLVYLTWRIYRRMNG